MILRKEIRQHEKMFIGPLFHRIVNGRNDPCQCQPSVAMGLLYLVMILTIRFIRMIVSYGYLMIPSNQDDKVFDYDDVYNSVLVSKLSPRLIDDQNIAKWNLSITVASNITNILMLIWNIFYFYKLKSRQKILGSTVLVLVVGAILVGFHGFQNNTTEKVFRVVFSCLTTASLALLESALIENLASCESFLTQGQIDGAIYAAIINILGSSFNDKGQLVVENETLYFLLITAGFMLMDGILIAASITVFRRMLNLNDFDLADDAYADNKTTRNLLRTMICWFIALTFSFVATIIVYPNVASTSDIKIVTEAHSHIAANSKPVVIMFMFCIFNFFGGISASIFCQNFTEIGQWRGVVAVMLSVVRSLMVPFLLFPNSAIIIGLSEAVGFKPGKSFDVINVVFGFTNGWLSNFVLQSAPRLLSRSTEKQRLIGILYLILECSLSFGTLCSSLISKYL